MGEKRACSLCGRELAFTYSLQKYGVEGPVCGSCYDKKLKEVYRINR